MINHPAEESTQEIEPLLTVEDLAAILKMHPGSIKNRHCKDPSSLPPTCRIPCNKRLFWRREDVRKWLEQHVQVHVTMVRPEPAAAPKRKPGRPRKSEQLARQRAGVIVAIDRFNPALKHG